MQHPILAFQSRDFTARHAHLGFRVFIKLAQPPDAADIGFRETLFKLGRVDQAIGRDAPARPAERAEVAGQDVQQFDHRPRRPLLAFPFFKGAFGDMAEFRRPWSVVSRSESLVSWLF